jgi:2-C-methyl-D-erythritol 4-phosphate cytidylyltransferase/2-C-methyl-D-erythritol 2,4-cyclodiphosphate synthase
VTGAVAIILAAGTGERLRQGAESVPKAFKPFSSRETMLSMSVRAAAACPAIGSLIVTVPPDFEDRVGDLPSHDKLVVVIPGGESRQLSVSAGLRTLGDEVASVVCHDAARPFASSDLFAAVLAGLDQGADGVVPVVAVPDTVKRVEADAVVETVPRQELRLAQTPQAFRSGALADAHGRAAAQAKTFTDDAAMLEWAGYEVRVVEGEAGNFKITTAADFSRAEEILRG